MLSLAPLHGGNMLNLTLLHSGNMLSLAPLHSGNMLTLTPLHGGNIYDCHRVTEEAIWWAAVADVLNVSLQNWLDSNLRAFCIQRRLLMLLTLLMCVTKYEHQTWSQFHLSLHLCIVLIPVVVCNRSAIWLWLLSELGRRCGETQVCLLLLRRENWGFQMTKLLRKCARLQERAYMHIY